MDPVAVMESSFAPFDARLQPGRMDPVPVFAVDLDQTDLAARWAWVRDYAHHFHAARQLILGEVGVNADAPTPLWVQVGARAILSATPTFVPESLQRLEVANCKKSPQNTCAGGNSRDRLRTKIPFEVSFMGCEGQN